MYSNLHILVACISNVHRKRMICKRPHVRIFIEEASGKNKIRLDLIFVVVCVIIKEGDKRTMFVLHFIFRTCSRGALVVYVKYFIKIFRFRCEYTLAIPKALLAFHVAAVGVLERV